MPCQIFIGYLIVLAVNMVGSSDDGDGQICPQSSLCCMFCLSQRAGASVIK